jgi:hypothetical protein
LSLLERFRRQRGEEPGAGSDKKPAEAAPPPLPRRAAPSPGALRRERRAILRAREERIRDLGGLALEMHRRDRFREDLLADQCQEVLGLEARLNELDTMLAAAAVNRRAPAARCECGAPVIWGSHFCANCGRPVGERPVVSCVHCGHPLPADAKYCADCGKEAEFELEAGEGGSRAYGAAAEETVGRTSGNSSEQSGSAERERDPWEQ